MPYSDLCEHSYSLTLNFQRSCRSIMAKTFCPAFSHNNISKYWQLLLILAKKIPHNIDDTELSWCCIGLGSLSLEFLNFKESSQKLQYNFQHLSQGEVISGFQCSMSWVVKDLELYFDPISRPNHGSDKWIKLCCHLQFWAPPLSAFAVNWNKFAFWNSDSNSNNARNQGTWTWSKYEI